MLPITTKIQPEICHKSLLNCNILFSWKKSSRKSEDLKPNYFPLPKDMCTQSSTVLYILLIWCFLLYSTVKATNAHRTWGKCSPDPILQYHYIQLCRNSSLPHFAAGSLLKYFHFYCSLSHLIYLFIYYFINLEDPTASSEYIGLIEFEVIIFQMSFHAWMIPSCEQLSLALNFFYIKHVRKTTCKKWSHPSKLLF